MSIPPQDIIKFYCNRGRMENFIKESKNRFNFKAMISSKMSINSNSLQMYMLAYNLFNWFRRLVLPLKMSKLQIDTPRVKLIKFLGKTIHSGRYITFKLCNSCAYKREFFEILSNISKLHPN